MDTSISGIICNMTPHAFHIRDTGSSDGFITIPPSGVDPRMVPRPQVSMRGSVWRTDTSLHAFRIYSHEFLRF